MFPSTGPHSGEPPNDPGTSGTSGRPGPLRRGRYGLSRAELEVYHRDRIFEATVNIVGVGGYPDLSVSSITELAGVTRQAFYALYESPNDAFLAAYREVLLELLDGLATATPDGSSPPGEGLRQGVAAAVDFLVAEPVRAALILVEVHAAGPDAIELQQRGLDAITHRVAEMLHTGGMTEVEAQRDARFGVGAIREALRTRVARGELRELPTLVPELCAAAFPAVGER